jgi:hypothetical protein
MSGGGGYGSKNVVNPNVKIGSGSTGIRPSYTNAPGSHFGDHSTDGTSTGYRGPKREDGKSFQPVPFGNQVALNVGKGGCGTSRTLYGQAGSQGTHDSVLQGGLRLQTPKISGRSNFSREDLAYAAGGTAVSGPSSVSPNTSGWRTAVPIGPPPGVVQADLLMDEQDRRDRHELILQEARRRAAEELK